MRNCIVIHDFMQNLILQCVSEVLAQTCWGRGLRRVAIVLNHKYRVSYSMKVYNFFFTSFTSMKILGNAAICFLPNWGASWKFQEFDKYLNRLCIETSNMKFLPESRWWSLRASAFMPSRITQECKLVEKF